MGSNAHLIGVGQHVNERRSAAQLLQEGCLPLLHACRRRRRGFSRNLCRGAARREVNADVGGLGAGPITQEVAERNCFGDFVGRCGSRDRREDRGDASREYYAQARNAFGK